MITALLPIPFLIPISLSAVAVVTSLLTALKISQQKNIAITTDDDDIITFELSERQHRYREALENKD